MNGKYWRIFVIALIGAFVEIGFSTKYPFVIQAISTVIFFVVFGACFMAGIEYQREL